MNWSCASLQHPSSNVPVPSALRADPLRNLCCDTVKHLASFSCAQGIYSGVAPKVSVLIIDKAILWWFGLLAKPFLIIGAKWFPV